MSNLSEILNNSKYIDILNTAGQVGKEMGIKTYVVGGYIRDAILNRELKDIDIMVENNVFEFSSKLAKKLKVKTIITIFRIYPSFMEKVSNTIRCRKNNTTTTSR